MTTIKTQKDNDEEKKHKNTKYDEKKHTKTTMMTSPQDLHRS